MDKSLKLLSTTIAVTIVLTCTAGLAKDTKTVRIISDTNPTSTYVMATPGSQSVNCAATDYSVNCTGRTLPAITRSLNVTGHVLYLELPDKRVVVASCDAKFNWTEWHQGVYRSCRMPLVDTVQAEFSADNVKLVWSVSLDGKKMQSETYKILGVLTPR